jgi:hypothetical protein
MERTVNDLEARVDALARELRWTRGGAAAAVGIALVAFAGPIQSAPRSPAPAEVKATRFVLVDAAGTQLGAQEAGADRAPRLQLRGAADKPGVVVEAGENPRVWVAAAGTSRGGATLTTEGGSPRLALKDAEGRDRLWVALRLGSPAVQFLNPAGLARSGLTSFNDDGGVAVISDAGGASPGLVLYGKERSIVWSAP